MDAATYLERIGYNGPLDVSLGTLRALHRAHLMTVPFENLDIHLGRLIVLEHTALFDKIVRRRRGGFCYELNGMFAWLLGQLGFEVTMLQAGVAREGGGFGPDFDHMTLLVRLDREWLADVGFGESFLEPLQIGEHSESLQHRFVYLVTGDGHHLFLQRRQSRTLGSADSDNPWKPQYRFDLRPREFGDYNEMCVYHQTSPKSTFTQRRVCTRATAEGRVTLTGSHLIVTSGPEKDDRAVTSNAEYTQLLRKHFGIELPCELVG
ncbi:MAG TPA: arylamine N-acetyltransferase [Blastocatellia bacterium]|nr:arylamine N-acetyltransferase [Blastocatellia bacterium]